MMAKRGGYLLVLFLVRIFVLEYKCQMRVSYQVGLSTSPLMTLGLAWMLMLTLCCLDWSCRLTSQQNSAHLKFKRKG